MDNRDVGRHKLDMTYEINKMVAYLKAEQNLYEKLAYLPSIAPHLNLTRQVDVTLVTSPFPITAGNIAFNIRVPEKFQSERLQELGHYFGQRKVPYQVCVGPNSNPQRLLPILKRQDFQLKGHGAVMVLHMENEIKPPPKNPDIVFKTLKFKSTREDACALSKIAENPAYELTKSLIHLGHDPESPYRRYLAYAEKQCVG